MAIAGMSFFLARSTKLAIFRVLSDKEYEDKDRK